ncbi:hypothetical protein [Conyzicola sp.]
MFRLLKYVPIVLPIVTKAVKSPQGQRALAKVKASIQAKRNGTAGGTR